MHGNQLVLNTMVVYCFDGCSGLTSITIPSSVTSLGDCCFYGCKNLGIVYFKGKKCNSNYKILYIPTTCIIKVPAEYLQGYKDAFGPNYKYIYAWNPDETGEDNKPVTQCSTPSVSYGEGKLMFACATAGAKYHYTITDTDIKSDALSENGKYLFLQPIIFLFMLQQMDIKHLIRRRQLCIGLMLTWILVPISIW